MAKAISLTDNTVGLLGKTCKTCDQGKLVIITGKYGKFIGCDNKECRNLDDTALLKV